MDGILNILIVLGFIGFAVYKQISKTEDKPADKPAVPYGMEEVFPEITYIPPPPAPPAVKKQSKSDKRFKSTLNDTKPGEVLIEPLEEDGSVNSDIDTHSIDEIRKGIIWSEILNRKY